MLSRTGTLSVVICLALLIFLSTIFVDRTGSNALLLRGSDPENVSTEYIPTVAVTNFLRGSETIEDETVMSKIIGSECRVISSRPYSMLITSECKEASKCLVEVAKTDRSRKSSDEIVRRINESSFPGLLKVAQHRHVDEAFNYISLTIIPEDGELVSVSSVEFTGTGIEAQINNIINFVNRQGIWTNLHMGDKESLGHAFAVDTKSERVYLISLATLSLMED